MRRALRIGLISLALSTAPLALLAQDRATLLSDKLELGSDAQLVATGNVEIFYQDRKLTAQKLVFDQNADRIAITGPLVLTDKGGQTTILADQADLSSDMSAGILSSARIVMQEQMQLAAAQIERSEGRYTTLDNAVASSCQVCAARPIPLWDIRAKRVVHDQEERQIYFDHATLRLRGVPIAYFPYFRLPDPTLDRSDGFLSPSIRTTSNLGYGVKIPYFVTLGPTRDLTIAPYLTTKNSQTMALTYRQAFANGGIFVDGQYTRDQLTHQSHRGYTRAIGLFRLPNDVNLSFSLQNASDNAYLVDYGLPNTDRLDSRVELSRVKRNGFFSARVISFQTLRDSEDSDTLPSVIVDGTFHRRFSLGPLGGEGGLRLQAHSHLRNSTNPFDGPDPDLIADGRDMSRLSSRIDWRRAFILPFGLEAVALGEAKLDFFRIREDFEFNGNHTRAHTAAGVELRWPWTKAAQSGATHVIEPVIQLITSDRHNNNRPIEDAWLVDFDEGNLMSLDRFPGGDAVEQGSRANIGVSWTRYDPQGWNSGFTLGRVLRNSDPKQFGPNSGLANDKSDWLAAASIESASGLSTIGRAVFDDKFSIAKSELRLAKTSGVVTMGGSFLWTKADPWQERYTASREMILDANWGINPDLSARFHGRYDFEKRSTTMAGIGIALRNDCMAVDMEVTRRFTSSNSIKPSTDFGLSVDLLGIGGRKAKGASKRCY